MKKGTITKKRIFMVLLSFLIFISIATIGSAISNDHIDSLLEKSMKDSNLPGIAVGIIKNNDTVYLDTKGIDGNSEK